MMPGVILDAKIAERLIGQHQTTWRLSLTRKAVLEETNVESLINSLIDLRSLWMERAKRLRRDPLYTDCAVTLELCADELSSVWHTSLTPARREPRE
jgi:hypothetical protein